jgi:hypothetical protein
MASCWLCDVGLYSASSSTKCTKSCAAGRYATTDLPDLGPGVSGGCLTCALGRYSSANKVNISTGVHGSFGSCDRCSAGKYNDQLEQKSCKDCPTGKRSWSTLWYAPGSMLSSRSLNGPSSCAACPLGYHLQQYVLGSPARCAPDTSSPTTQPTSTPSAAPTQVHDCPAGEQLVVDELDKQTLGRTVRPLKDDEIPDVTPDDMDRIANGPGRSRRLLHLYQPTTKEQLQREMKQCRSCTIGTYRKARGVFCFACPPGKFAPNTASTGCTACPVGYFQILPSMHQCTSCPVRSFQPYTGRHFCLPEPTKYLWDYKKGWHKNTGWVAIPQAKWIHRRNDHSYWRVQDMQHRAWCASGRFILPVDDDHTYFPHNKKSSLNGLLEDSWSTGSPVDDDPDHASIIDPDPESSTYGLLEGRPRCADCPQGYFQYDTDAGGCKQCPLGKWTGSGDGQYYCMATLPPSVAPTPRPTLPTPAPSLSPSAAPTAAPVAHFTACAEGMGLHGYRTDGSGGGECLPCPVGKYRSAVSVAREAAELHNKGGMIAPPHCAACPEGQYQPLKGQPVCYEGKSPVAQQQKQEEIQDMEESLEGGAMGLGLAGAPQQSSGLTVTAGAGFSLKGGGTLVSTTTPAPTPTLDCAAGMYHAAPFDSMYSDCTQCNAGRFMPRSVSKSSTRTSVTSCSECPTGYTQPQKAQVFCYKLPPVSAADAAMLLYTSEPTMQPTTSPPTSGPPNQHHHHIHRHHHPPTPSPTLPCALGSEPAVLTSANASAPGCTPCERGHYNDGKQPAHVVRQPRAGRRAPGLVCKRCPFGKYNTVPGGTSCGSEHIIHDPEAGDGGVSQLGVLAPTLPPTLAPTAAPSSDAIQDYLTSIAPQTPPPTPMALVAPWATPEARAMAAAQEKVEASMLPCSPGKWAAEASARGTECKLCSKGQYSDSPGARACIKCAVGTFSPLPGAYACKACLQGQWIPYTGSNYCMVTKAPSATPTNAPTPSALDSCPPGRYGVSYPQAEVGGSLAYNALRSVKSGGGADGGRVYCDLCPWGQYQPQPETEGCVLCPAGYATSTDGSSCIGQSSVTVVPGDVSCAPNSFSVLGWGTDPAEREEREEREETQAIIGLKAAIAVHDQSKLEAALAVAVSVGLKGDVDYIRAKKALAVAKLRQGQLHGRRRLLGGAAGVDASGGYTNQNSNGVGGAAYTQEYQQLQAKMAAMTKLKAKLVAMGSTGQQGSAQPGAGSRGAATAADVAADVAAAAAGGSSAGVGGSMPGSGSGQSGQCASCPLGKYQPLDGKAYCVICPSISVSHALLITTGDASAASVDAAALETARQMIKYTRDRSARLAPGAADGGVTEARLQAAVYHCLPTRPPTPRVTPAPTAGSVGSVDSYSQRDWMRREEVKLQKQMDVREEKTEREMKAKLAKLERAQLKMSQSTPSPTATVVATPDGGGAVSLIKALTTQLAALMHGGGIGGGGGGYAPAVAAPLAGALGASATAKGGVSGCRPCPPGQERVGCTAAASVEGGVTAQDVAADVAAAAAGGATGHLKETQGQLWAREHGAGGRRLEGGQGAGGGASGGTAARAAGVAGGAVGGGACQYCAAGRYKADWGAEPCSRFEAGAAAAHTVSAAVMVVPAVTPPPAPTPKPNTHGNCKPGRYLLQYMHSSYCMTW